MLISTKHLNEIVDLSQETNESLEHQLSCFGGLEVEAYQPLIEDRGYVVGHVVTLEKHPDADKLSVCQVDVGEKNNLQIVCGAGNVAQGAFVIVAKVGTILPDGLSIASREVRGIESNGMLCALQEIGLDEKFVADAYKDGIYLFENKTVTPGENAIQALEFDTTVFDLDITPNRADCLSYRGVAYEVGALFDKDVHKNLLDFPIKFGTLPMEQYIQSLTIESSNVLDYQLLVFDDVKVAASPQWMQSFLIASGVRPINNVVDITNYVMLYLGQPLHAFDANKITDGDFIIRQANEGETLVTLDEQERKLEVNDIIIASKSGPLALAGVMGGLSTAIDSSSTSIVIESAIFDPINIRKTAARLNLRSDASQRFEKGIDPELPQMALGLVTKLLVELTGATVGNKVIGQTISKMSNKPIVIDYEFITTEIGIQMTKSEISSIFRRLQFEVEESGDRYMVTVPTRRGYMSLREDIVEEIVRIFGYENIPSTLPIDVSRPVFKTEYEHFIARVHEKMLGQGLNEILTYALTSPEKALIGQDDASIGPIIIKYPLNNERSAMRTTPFVHMIETLQYHKNRNIEGVTLYEVANLYHSSGESQVLSFGGYGITVQQKVYENTRNVDFYLMKYWFESLLPQNNENSVAYIQSKNPLFHPGVSADVYINDQHIGTFGKIHPLFAKRLDVDTSLYFGSINLNTLYQIVGVGEVQYNMVSTKPVITRDLSFVVPKTMPMQMIVSTIETNAGEDFKQVTLKDIYENADKMGDNRSVTFALTYSNESITLTNETVDQQIGSLLKQVEKEIGAQLRE